MQFDSLGFPMVLFSFASQLSTERIKLHAKRPHPLRLQRLFLLKPEGRPVKQAHPTQIGWGMKQTRKMKKDKSARTRRRGSRGVASSIGADRKKERPKSSPAQMYHPGHRK